MISLKTVVFGAMMLCIITGTLAASMFLDAIDAGDTFAAWVNGICTLAMAGCAVTNYHNYNRF